MKTTTQTINDKVVCITPESDEGLEYAIIINSVMDGVCINQRGQDIYIPSYAVKEVCKQLNALNNGNS